MFYDVDDSLAIAPEHSGRYEGDLAPSDPNTGVVTPRVEPERTVEEAIDEAAVKATRDSPLARMLTVGGYTLLALLVIVVAGVMYKNFVK